MWCQLSPQTLQNATLAALVCAAPPDDPCPCVAICPNPDISGVGVRSAFYLQSVMNTLLVIFSRRDSVPSAWASTLLTASLVIAAMVQKGNQSITLHHATLTMNFATLSCISSLAVAPTLSIWRLSTESYYIRQLAHHVLNITFQEGSQTGNGPVLEEKDRTRIQRAQGKQRLFLALALLTQVVLQWAWGIVLFVSPVYSQTNCSGDTALIFFLARFRARDINHKYMVVWVFWLLFSLGTTLCLTVVLAVTSPSRARASSRMNSRSSSVASRSSRSARRPPIYMQLFSSVWDSFPSWGDRDAQLVFWYNIVATMLWAVYLISSELQIHANTIFAGENEISSFGQASFHQSHHSLAPVRTTAVELDRCKGAVAVLFSPPAIPRDPLPLRASPPLPHLAAHRFFCPLEVGRLLSFQIVRLPAAPSSPCLKVPPVTSRTLNDVYIQRTSASEWHELVSLTRLPRAQDGE
ncbi:hypothetical protein BN946_scf184970.g145 [Trametes cinnabarina]|uniref:Uncharacterized protein n=1 Tax=Pycnoporus cinnabarinus TaxID=5643 RepID=A0A060SIR6_PYCCI|nr:hypothetical protein BN946_scf184970.g145 [Trametes cinnabarina]